MANQWRPRGHQRHLRVSSTVPRSMMNLMSSFSLLCGVLLRKQIFLALFLWSKPILFLFDLMEVAISSLLVAVHESTVKSSVFVVRFIQSNYILVTLTCRQPVNVVGFRLAYALLWITFDTTCWFLKIHDTLIRFSILWVVRHCKRSAPTLAVKLQAKHSISFRTSFLSTSTGKTDYWKQKNS